MYIFVSKVNKSEKIIQLNKHKADYHISREASE